MKTPIWESGWSSRTYVGCYESFSRENLAMSVNATKLLRNVSTLFGVVMLFVIGSAPAHAVQGSLSRFLKILATGNLRILQVNTTIPKFLSTHGEPSKFVARRRSIFHRGSGNIFSTLRTT